ncbi:MAG: nitroreductase family protein, partial [Dehalococcoidia bacterium]|nr:nitroreductase family protein [Dehalococcoidia bacterium]
MIRDLIIKNRSTRRFYQEVAIERRTLRELIDLARHSASAANLQPLKYILSCDSRKNSLIFPHLFWAGYLKDWPGPCEGQRPSAYIIILGDKRLSKSFGCDHGIAAQSILLGVAEKGLGGCIIGTVQRQKLRKALDIPSRYEILLV